MTECHGTSQGKLLEVGMSAQVTGYKRIYETGCLEWSASVSQMWDRKDGDFVVMHMVSFWVSLKDLLIAGF